MQGNAVRLLVGLIVCATLGGCAAESASPTVELVPGIASAEHLPEDATWEWSPRADCSFCHASESASLSMISCVDANSEITCLTCHTNITGLTHAHADIEHAKPSSRLRSTVMADATCERCHDTSELAARTAGSTALSDVNGVVVNPHDLKASHNAKGQHNGIACVDCHAMHDADGGSGNGATAMARCTTCHPGDT